MSNELSLRGPESPGRDYGEAATGGRSPRQEPGHLNDCGRRPDSGLSSCRSLSHTAVARSIFQSLLRRKRIDNSDRVRLLHAKQQARLGHDRGFELLLLETGRLIDERVRDGAPVALLKEFSRIVDLFDHYDHTATCIGKVAIMQHYIPGEDQLFCLLNRRRQFDSLGENLFSALFFDAALNSLHVGRYGRMKLNGLKQGLEMIEAGFSSITALSADLRFIDAEERLYLTMFQAARERFRTDRAGCETPSEQALLHKDLNSELLRCGHIRTPVGSGLFRTIIHDLKTENFYLKTLLPRIVSNDDRALRNEFLAGSGLDHFHIEELEREYFESHQLDPDRLRQLRNSSI